MLDKEKKARLRAALRVAIRTCNETWQFSCYDCMNCVDESKKGIYTCLSGVVVIPSKDQLPGAYLPECFRLNYVDNPYGDLLTYMITLGVEFFDAPYGWGTVVTRVIQRANRYGHLMNIRPDNLETF